MELILCFPGDRAAVGHCSFEYTNPYIQVEVVGTEAWLALPGTGFRREPHIPLMHHHYQDPGDEIFLHGKEPVVQEFPLVDPYTLEVEHLGACILEDKQPRWGLDDALRNTRALLAVHQSIREGREVPIRTGTASR